MSLADFKFALKLAFANVRNRPARLFLATLTTIASACVVVWVVSSYDSLVSKFDEFSDNYVGRYDFVVVPSSAQPAPDAERSLRSTAARLDTSLVQELKVDNISSIVDPVVQSRVRGSKLGAERQSSTTRRPGFGPSPFLVGTPASEPPNELTAGEWLVPNDDKSMVAVISHDTASEMGIGVRGEVEIEVASGKRFVLTIIGIIKQRQSLPSPPPIIGLPAMKGPPLTTGPASAALYVTQSLYSSIVGPVNGFDYLGIVLKPNVTIEQAKQRWGKRLAEANVRGMIVSLEDANEELNHSSGVEAVRAQAYSATGISLLAAMFVIFSTVSMGVDERIRQFAMLRAVVCTKAQIATMVVSESLALGVVGWIGGLFSGWVLLEYLMLSKPALFPVGATLGFWCIALSGACALGGSLLAAILPAWKATSVQPIETMSRSAISSYTLSFKLLIFGSLLLLVNPLFVFWLPITDESRYVASAAVGCVCMGVGFVLLAPLVLKITQVTLSPMIATIFGINRRLLSTQLASNLWRSLGATIALTLGLGLYVSMQVWGYSMLAPFTPGRWVPDFVVTVNRGGVSESDVEKILHLPAVDTQRSLPCVSEQVLFATDVTGAAIRATSSRQNNCVMVGVDPERGFGGLDPVFDFTFIRGNRDEAAAKLLIGRYCLVPDHFERESGLTVGDKFGVVRFGGDRRVIEYEIAGVVSMSGWHWMSKVGLRNHNGGRSAGLMFTDIRQIQDDFAVSRVNTFWLNAKDAITEDALKAGIEAVVTTDSIVNRSSDSNKFGFGRSQAAVNVRSREGVRVAIRERADGIIWLLSRLPLITLLVSSLGIINTIVSSIRARRWDMGVMRSVGVTRFTLIRLILCEAIVIGVAACVLSFAFGLLAGYCGTGVTRYVNVRGGQIVPLVIPWAQIGFGFLLTLGLCLIAAIWPALRTGYSEPLRLLREGRSAVT